MNIFQKLSLPKKIDEQAEMIEAYYLKVQNHYKNSYLGTIIAFGLTESEARMIGVNRPVDIEDFDRFGVMEYNSVHKRLYYFEKITSHSWTRERRENERITQRLPLYEEENRNSHLGFVPPVRPVRFQPTRPFGVFDDKIDEFKWYAQVREQKKATSQWIRTIGQKSVIVFKPYTSKKYLEMMNDYIPLFLKFKEMNFEAYGKYYNERWERIESFLKPRCEELQNGYIIEREKLY